MSSSDQDDDLAVLLERWEDATAHGKSITIDDVCGDRPELAPAFRGLLEKLGRLNGVLANGSSSANKEEEFELREAGRYRPIRFHARGGLGVVYLAEDEEVRREVALKSMRSLVSMDAGARRRFLLEAEITSKLDHPGIVPVYGLGVDPKGKPYYAMRFVQGTTLGEAIEAYHERKASDSEANVEFRRLIRGFISVCETMAYAHSRGIIHRDLKPGNIMLGPFGETLVLDWGLAKRLESSDAPMISLDERELAEQLGLADSIVDESVEGYAKGSPAFMSPEQARGEWSKVGPASDIYSLGSTLYSLLTGKRAYQATSAREIIGKVKRGVFPLPRQANRDTAKPLQAICVKAMSLQPEDRYASARDLAADLERWLADEPVSAWSEPFGVRARRWIKRNRTWVTAAAAALVIGTVVLGVMGARLDQKNRELNQRNADLEVANDKEKSARERAELHLRRNVGQLEGMLRFAISSKAMEQVRRDPVYLALLDHVSGNLSEFVRDEPDDVRGQRVLGLVNYLRAVADPATGLPKDLKKKLDDSRDHFIALQKRDASDPLAAWGIASTRIEQARRLFEQGDADAALAEATAAGDELQAQVIDDKVGELHALALAGCCELLADIWESKRSTNAQWLLTRMDRALTWLKAAPRQLNPEAFARVMTQAALDAPNSVAASGDSFWNAYLTALLHYRRGQILQHGLQKTDDAMSSWSIALREIERVPRDAFSAEEIDDLKARVRFDLGMAHRQQKEFDQAWRYIFLAREGSSSKRGVGAAKTTSEWESQLDPALIATALDYLKSLRPDVKKDRETAAEVLQEARLALDRYQRDGIARLPLAVHPAKRDEAARWGKSLDDLVQKFKQ